MILKADDGSRDLPVSVLEERTVDETSGVRRFRAFKREPVDFRLAKPRICFMNFRYHLRELYYTGVFFSSGSSVQQRTKFQFRKIIHRFLLMSRGGRLTRGGGNRVENGELFY